MRAHLGELPVEIREDGGGAAVPDDPAGGARLERLTGLDHVGRLPGGDGDHDGSPTGLEAQEALGRQSQERLVDRGAAETDLGADLRLAEQSTPGSSPVMMRLLTCS
ncbi:hypothetical protein GCM10025865_11170 [Paraoerskovia sediminicola]|uniref:Uncharacterized protein n=1 Tax=Paraoerskovia sediminicola TaxID=1138587 RepID=A0ABN6XAA1_9CELL|nr:hypothetical protein GCM10025865_11170 [Paraoerskovia sediminicola]